MFKVGTLVAYKGKPAKISAVTTHKYDLSFSDGSSRKVREKDFRYIHPNFASVNDQCPVADMSVLEDLQAESLSLKELTEWLFDDYSSQNAWCTNLLADDGLYFFWNKDILILRSTEQIKVIEKQRQVKSLEIESLQRCVDNLQNKIVDERDSFWLSEIEKVALNQSRHTKVLSALSIDNTPERAHQLLLKIGHWSDLVNPYLERHKIYPDEELTLDVKELTREDLTYLKSFAIDNSDSSDADDAISFDGEKVWIHIADVATQVDIDSELDGYAQKRASNLYLPDQTIHMLPPNLSSLCSLGESEKSSALSVGFKMIDCQISDIKILQSEIKVVKMSYEEADKALKEDKVLSKLNNLTKSHKAFRNNNGAIKLDLPNVDVKIKNKKVDIQIQTDSESRELVAEMMVIAGRVIAQYANEHEISMPFLTQEVGSFSEDIIQNKENLTAAQAFQATRCFKQSKITPKASLHAGLGLSCYVRVTSPIRRYLDLLTQQQLVRFINNQTTLDDTQIKQRITQVNAVISRVNKATRQSIEHFKCLFLKQNNNWRGKGIIVDLNGNKATLLIPEIAMITQLKLKSKAQLEDEIELRAVSINLENRSIDFKPL
ncbi:MAG: ribonuclease catalytic domain-containing protein [Candidatus Thioglobus autotrophicus]|nr:ribonuclease catalytic domain-containing protein [Candidatus Thioglobus autotrophicus]